MIKEPQAIIPGVQFPTIGMSLAYKLFSKRVGTNLWNTLKKMIKNQKLEFQNQDF